MEGAHEDGVEGEGEHRVSALKQRAPPLQGVCRHRTGVVAIAVDVVDFGVAAAVRQRRIEDVVHIDCVESTDASLDRSAGPYGRQGWTTEGRTGKDVQEAVLASLCTLEDPGGD